MGYDTKHGAKIRSERVQIVHSRINMEKKNYT